MSSGILYIVATPIGNLEDITYRAIRILKEVETIYAEDTSVSRKLLSHYDIQNTLISCNARNEEQKIPEILQRLKSGQDLAIITDAGTPGISDPSVRIVSAARDAELSVFPIPGPAALTAALSVAGIPTNQFYFHGFLPNKKGRQTQLELLSSLHSTIILYESVYRIFKTLEQIEQHIGNRYVVVCREITKKFESYYAGLVSDILKQKDQIKEKGEFVILIAPEGFSKH